MLNNFSIVHCLAAMVMGVFMSWCSGAYAAEPKPKLITWKLEAEFPHDPSAFTQGLEVFEGRYFLESTGQYGRSQIRKVEIVTGHVVSQESLDRKYFGEGLTRVGNNILQLTWQEGVIIKWSMGKGSKSFEQRATIPWSGEGWGITQGQGELFVSNGTSQLTVIDPKTFKQKRTLKVQLSGEPMDRLNELEFIDGKIFANVWMTSTVVRIDPKSGKIDGLMDLSPLVPKGISMDAVANGIAWDATKKRLYVTGKLWPKVFKLQLLN